MQSLSREEILSLLTAARAHRERDWLMILLAFNHGLRASEVVSIQAGNISDGFLTVQRLKGSLKTIQPLIESSEPLLDEKKSVFAFVRKMGEKQKLFPVTRERFWQIVQQHAKAAGLPKHLRHPHCLKHSIGAQLIATPGVGIQEVRQWMGHRSLNSTGEYLRVTDEQAGAAARRALR